MSESKVYNGVKFMIYMVVTLSLYLGFLLGPIVAICTLATIELNLIGG